MAGKTAPACLMQFSPDCLNVSCSRSDCLLVSDGNVSLMKPYSSAPNIDLLHHVDEGRSTRVNEAEDIPQAVKSVSQDKQRGRSIPEIVVVYSNNETSNEPDIVQSTKSNSLPRPAVTEEPPQPVAPPRKKKSKSPSTVLFSDPSSEVCTAHVLCIHYMSLINCHS